MFTRVTNSPTDDLPGGGIGQAVQGTKLPIGSGNQEKAGTDLVFGKALRWLVNWMAEHRSIPIALVDPGLSPADLDLDSLEALELSLDIELEYGIQAPFGEGWGKLSIRDAARKFAEAACEAN